MAFKKVKNPNTDASPGGLGERLFRARKQSAAFPWRDVDPALLAALLECCTASGAAVMFGGVQGGRGISVTIFHEGEKVKEYCNTLIEFRQFSAVVIDGVQGTAEDYFTAYDLDRKALEDGR